MPKNELSVEFVVRVRGLVHVSWGHIFYFLCACMCIAPLLLALACPW